MKTEPPPSPDPRDDIELQILLHSTQELSPQEANMLAGCLEKDAGAAAFFQFLHETLPAVAKAPRDFAAMAIDYAVAPRDFAEEAISLAMQSDKTSKVVQFPHMRKYAVLAAAAAVVVFLVMPTILNRRPQQTTEATTVAVTEPSSRITSHLSARLDALESELLEPSLRQSRVRHQRFTTL